MKLFLKRASLWRFETPPMDHQQVDALLTFLILGVIVGGRLGYVLFYNLDFYIQNPVSILRLFGMVECPFMEVLLALFWQ